MLFFFFFSLLNEQKMSGANFFGSATSNFLQDDLDEDTEADVSVSAITLVFISLLTLMILVYFYIGSIRQSRYDYLCYRLFSQNDGC